LRGDRAGPRIFYLEGDVEIMSPSRTHEVIKKLIARLVEAYADEQGIELMACGSETLRHAPRARGAEPDECYVVGANKEVPDLAIEVIWTSGGLDKLEIYRGLGVRELWIWREGELAIHLLPDGAASQYVRVNTSSVFPTLEVSLLARYAAYDSQTQAVREFRAALRAAVAAVEPSTK
jgi:Uma2 family endonuclease